jgi:hypothetical protein
MSPTLHFFQGHTLGLALGLTLDPALVLTQGPTYTFSEDLCFFVIT